MSMNIHNGTSHRDARDDGLAFARVETPIGTLTLAGSDTGLREVWFAGQAPPRAADAAGPASARPPVLDAAAAQLDEYFAGQRTAFDLPLDVRGPYFQRQAWLALASIPYGSTVSYGEQARRIGYPGAARAVGAANARNPLPVILPCHRVIGANGSLTGFGGGLGTKRWLLEHEMLVGSRLSGGSRTTDQDALF
jgi:methylated-DNA-[protein]-cysteine S-methyltransferase